MKKQIGRFPVLGPMLKRSVRFLRAKNFKDSATYWENRYSDGGTSGVGSYGKYAQFKAEFLNSFVKTHNINQVCELGCGDGHQLSLSNYPAYVGFDVSKAAVTNCIERYATDGNKSFFLYDPDCFLDNVGIFAFDLALSLDVIYHLVEDDVFHRYMEHIFSLSKRFVIIYSSNTNNNVSRFADPHVKHRKFTDWIEQNVPNWELVKSIQNPYTFDRQHGEGSWADFFVYERHELQKG